MAGHNNFMYRIGCSDPIKAAKAFCFKIKNPVVKTGLVPRLHLGDGLYAGNALVKHHGGKALK